MNAEEVKALRQRLGLTQREFALKIGTTIASVSMWERGQVKPKLMATTAMANLDKKPHSFGEDDPVYDAG